MTRSRPHGVRAIRARTCLPPSARQRSSLRLVPGRPVTSYVVASAWHWITPVLIGHAMVVLVAEVAQSGRDRDPLKRPTLELGVDRQQFRVGVPPGVVECPATPGRVRMRDLLCSREPNGFYRQGAALVDLAARPREDVARTSGEERLIRPRPRELLIRALKLSPAEQSSGLGRHT